MDCVFAYRGYHGCPSHCRLRVYEPDPERPEEAGRPPVVIATEREDNPGTSVTNRIERIASEVFRLLERPEAGITVVEHYEDRRFLGAKPLARESFALVTMTWTRFQGFVGPRWTPSTRKEVEAMNGKTWAGW